MNITEIAEQLADGKVVELPGGKSIRIRLDYDPDTSFADFPDCYGQVECIRRGYIGHAERPDWADGAAKKIWAGNDGYWWRPPSDILGDKDAVKQCERTIHDLLIYGWQIIFVEILDEETDAYGSSIVRDVATLGGIEWYMLDDESRAGVIADILSWMELPVAV